MEPNNSPLMAGMTRLVATENSLDLEILRMEKELGIRSSKGELQTEAADEERAQIRAASEEKIQKVLDSNQPKPELKGFPGPGALRDSLSVAADMAIDAGKQVVGGAADAVQSLANFGIDMANWADNKIGDGLIIPEDNDLTFAKDLIPESKYPPNKVLRAVSQFAVPYFGATRVANLTSKLGKGIAAISTDLLAFEGDQDRFSNLVQEIPELANPVTAWLSDRDGDSDLEGRVKNAIEGLGLGVMSEGFFKALGVFKRKKVAKEALDQVEKMNAGEPGQFVVPETKPIKVPQDLMNVKPSDVVGIEVRPAVDPPLKKKLDVDPKDLTRSVSEINTGGGYQLNLEKIDADTDVLSVIKNFAEKDKHEIMSRIGPKQTETQLQLLAKQLSVGVDELLAKRPGEAFSAEELYAARVFHASAAENLTELAKKAATGSEADKYAFMQGVQAFKAINLTLTGAKNEAGRALKSLSYKVAGDNPKAAEMITNYIEAFGDKNVVKLARLVSELPAEDISKIVRKSGYQKLFDAALEVRINNLLANPTTHVRNNISNFAANWYQNLEYSVAPLFRPSAQYVDPAQLKNAIERQKVLSKIDTTNMTYGELATYKKDLADANKVVEQAAESGVERGEYTFGQTEEARAIVQESLAAFSGVVDGLRGLKKTIFSGDPEEYKAFFSSPNTDYFSKLEGFQPAVTSDNFGGGPITDILGGIHRMPTKALDWADNYWKAVNYRMEVHRLSASLGMKMGLTGDELKKFVTEYANDPADSIRLMAEKRARVNTFTNPLDTEFGQTINDLIKTDIRGVQPIRFLIPFSRTPINISKFVIDRTPLAWFADSYQKAIAKGGREAQLARTQMALGTTLMATMSGIAYMTGKITGGGSGNRQQNAEQEKLQKKKYSTLIGDTYVPNSSFGEPFASYLNLAGDMAEISHAIGNEIEVRDSQEVGALIAWSLVNSASPDQVVRGFSDIITMIQEGKTPKSMGADMAASTIPFSGFLKPIRGEMDNVKRDTSVAKDDPAPFLQEILNKWKSQIPGLSDELPGVKNMFGEDITLPNAIGPDAISPIYTTKVDKKDVVIPELFRLGYGGPFAKSEPAPGESHLSITMPERELSIGGNKVTLNPHQYARYVELSGGHDLEIKIRPKGSSFTKERYTLKENLAEVIKDDYQNELTPKYRTDKNKRIVLKNTILGYRRAATEQMLQEFPELQGKLKKSVESNKDASMNEESELRLEVP